MSGDTDTLALRGMMVGNVARLCLDDSGLPAEITSNAQWSLHAYDRLSKKLSDE